MNCQAFRERIFLLQAGELSGPERRDCESHLAACPSCTARLRFEDGMLRTLEAKLPRESAPPGLETRIRAALRTERAPRAGGAGWLPSRWLVASAAAAAVLALVALAVSGPWRGRGTAADRPASGTVTVVDLDCDRVGRSYEEQRRCLDPAHVNALKLADGSYWTIAAEPAEFRYLQNDPALRGHKLRVVGRLVGGSNVLRVELAERVEARRRLRARAPFALPAAASGVP